MPFGRNAALVLLSALLAPPVAAADFSDPTWPCVQRKVGELSAGLMWPAVIEPLELDETRSRAVAELSELLALRRIEVESLQAEVETFAAEQDADMALMGQVFERVFAALSKRRGRIIDGIGDFSLSQIALAEQIERTRVAMNEALRAAEPDHDRIDTLEEQLDWDQTIYTDRQQSITYLCETPVLLEKRLFAIAQLLAGAARDKG